MRSVRYGVFCKIYTRCGIVAITPASIDELYVPVSRCRLMRFQNSSDFSLKRMNAPAKEELVVCESKREMAG